MAGKDVYEKLIKGYTEKQWGRSCKELPAFIIKRVPLRFTYDNNYFNDLYQGIPVGGYTAIVNKMLDGIEVRTGMEYKQFLKQCQNEGITFGKTLYTGMIDEYFDYKIGALEYRSLKFEQEQMPDCVNYFPYILLSIFHIHLFLPKIVPVLPDSAGLKCQVPVSAYQ